jgi:excisionase family DNA binding protein
MTVKRIGSNGQRGQDRSLLDVPAAAIYMGCSQRFMRRLVQERRIPFVKLGGTKVRFLVLDLDRWVMDQRVEARW